LDVGSNADDNAKHLQRLDAHLEAYFVDLDVQSFALLKNAFGAGLDNVGDKS